MKFVGKREAPMTLSKQRKLLGNHLNFAAAEAYKLLRTNLMFALPNNNECRVIGITSALRGEGKSTTSVNLAYTIAQTGERVLMIEADMRLPNVAQRLALRPTLGLSDLLAGLCTREEAIQESGMLDNLRIIAAGSIPPNPMELLGSEQMTQQLAELKKEFDFIIFDLPPVNAVADGLVISRLVQGMVVVVRQDYGDRSSLSVAVRRLQYLNVKILGFVMTYSHAEKKAYKYRKYGYGYGYGYYGKKGRAVRPTPTTMIDFHTHILPGIDDGSRSADESIQMLRAMPEVTHVWPHRISMHGRTRRRGSCGGVPPHGSSCGNGWTTRRPTYGWARRSAILRASAAVMSCTASASREPTCCFWRCPLRSGAAGRSMTCWSWDTGRSCGWCWPTPSATRAFTTSGTGSTLRTAPS